MPLGVGIIVMELVTTVRTEGEDAVTMVESREAVAAAELMIPYVGDCVRVSPFPNCGARW